MIRYNLVKYLVFSSWLYIKPTRGTVKMWLEMRSKPIEGNPHTRVHFMPFPGDT